MGKIKNAIKRMLLPLFLLGLGGLTACRTAQPLPPLDLSEVGWSARQGQAVWRANKDAAEISGELILATHTDGYSFVQFTKTPLPFVVARTGSDFWQLQFVPNNRTYSGHGNPPRQIIWFQLPRCLSGMSTSKPYSWQRWENNRWRLENRLSGELLEGYLVP